MRIKNLTSWRDSARAFCHPRVVTMLFFGFSAGMPLLLIFSSLSLWLREAGVDRSAVTFFSWAALGYSFKFVWAPLVDQLPIPFFTRMFGRRRAWILAAQLSIMAAIGWMALVDPASGQGPGQLTLMAMAAVFLGFSSATQDIAIDAYRIECAKEELQAMMASSYIAGYRMGMLAAGAGALFLADFFGSSMESYAYKAWQHTYLIMALFMVIGVVTTLVIDEPDTPFAAEGQQEGYAFSHARSFLLFGLAAAGFVLWFYFTGNFMDTLKSYLAQMAGHAHLMGFLAECLRLAGGVGCAVLVARVLIFWGAVDKAQVYGAYVAPISDFFARYKGGLAWLLLALIGLYRISDIVLGVISNVFYQDLGFTKTQIASVVKTFGLFMTIAGGFLGGICALRFGVIRALFMGALLSALTNLLFVAMAQAGPSVVLLYIVISADNLAGGLASAAFVAFLSSLTNVRFTAIQYAVFSSLMTLVPKVFSGYSGSMVDSLGYSAFFVMTALMGLPVLVLVLLCGKYLVTEKTQPQPCINK